MLYYFIYFIYSFIYFIDYFEDEPIFRIPTNVEDEAIFIISINFDKIHIFMKTKKNRGEIPVIFPLVSRPNLFYVSESRGFGFY